ncbi:MAG TPA: thiol reductant ABC exporter subunit CydC [Acidiphilium sp.]|nr:MAG: thiol reductant ABC exporter subunit CydC [Acidiphilium sp. 21-60-14]OYV90749.1 MAG: thiol reductant ABC exporter subunit CydC [Acidiphilium sp. 37-60-79]HQT89566.1 thiol reductant ABC exporter subunit CydC [Acidiphilium sp.]HQU24857.1 thiol reductant ABC exporter subunit CydC [Acidiphilium sp.]
MRDLIRLTRLYAPYWRWIAGGIALGVVTVLANFGLLALSGWFLTRAALVGLAGFAVQNAFNFFTPAAGVRFFATVRVLARYAGRLVDHETTFRLLARLRTDLYARLEPLAPVGLAGERGGELLARLVADIDRLGDFFLRVVAPSAVAMIGALLMALMFTAFSPLAGFVLLAGLALAGVGVPLISQKLGRGPSADAVRVQAAMRADLVDCVQGMAELLTYNAAPAMQARVGQSSAALAARQGRLAVIAGLGAGGHMLLAQFTMAATLVIGGWLVFRGALPGADVALLTLGAMAAFEAVAPLAGAFQAWGGMAESARRVFALVDRDTPVRDPAVSPPRPGQLDVQIRGVRLRYPGQAGWALDGLDLTLAPGERVAVIGRSGAGKTSLVNLLLRFAEYQEGSVQIGGVELRTIRGDDVRSLFTVVSQRSQIFAGTVRDNLLLARPDADDAALWRTLEIAQLADFVRAAPDGLDMLVGEAGVTLSGGQARRLTLARAALRDTPFLILDEPTEGLDPVTEQAVVQAIAEISVGRTVITIAHRLETIGADQRVITLARGCAVAS